MLTQLSLRLRIFLFFALLALGGSALLAAGLFFGYLRLAEPSALSSFVIAGVVGVAAILGLSAWIWTLFDEHVARPIERIAGEFRARAHSEVDRALDSDAARYLGDLAPAAAAVAQNLTETRNALALEVGRETARLSRERARLEALLAEAPQGVIFCSPEHRIVLYNGQTAELLGHSPALGLNRPLSDVLLTGPILQAHARLLAAESSEAADVLATTVEGARLIEVRLRLLRLEGQETGAPGYILSLTDVTRDLSAHADRARALNDLLAGVEAAASAAPAGASGMADLAALAARIGQDTARTQTEWWPMEALAASDLGAALSVRLARKGLALSVDLPETRLRCDGFAVTRLLERLALSWSASGADGLALHLVERNAGPALCLSAEGPQPDPQTLARWLDTPLSPGLSRFSGRDVLLSHGTELDQSPKGLAVPLTVVEAAPAVVPARIEYDFDLIHTELPADLAAADLRQLSFIVFDTETTGLNPAADEICQIAAVRVVNGRVLGRERFDLLVNPGRPIPAASTEVHGITDTMVAEAVGVGDALHRFHLYAGGAVLIAHNAPFDMSFLQRREAEIGKRFDQPILDTVLLSAILFGQSAEHTLDALCDRLDVEIPAADRHTAIGDALGTAEAFVRMLPMLEAAEIKTLGETIAAFDKHRRLLEHLN